MTKQADFTKEEWELLCMGPTLAGLGVSVVDTGLLSGLQEYAAIARATRDGKATYADNELVQGVAAEIERQGDVQLPEGMTAEAILEKLVQVDAILDEKGGADGNGYRNFLYRIADKTANAAGGFFGLGEKVSPEEAHFLNKLKEILFREQA